MTKSKAAKNEIEFHSISIPTTDVPYIPDDLWLKIFSYIEEPRHLAQNIRTCKRLNALLTKNDYLWLNALVMIQAEYYRMPSLNIAVHVNIPRDAGPYQKVAGYGKAIREYHAEIERNKPVPKTRLQKIIGTSNTLTGIGTVFAILVLFYLFFILLGLTLDKTTNVPPFVLFLLVLFTCFIVMGIVIAMAFKKPPSLDYLRTVIRCEFLTLIGAFMFAFNLMLLAIFTLVFTHTGNAQIGIWVFCGLGFGIIIFLLFTFECRASGLANRYGLAFRLFTAVSFSVFCLGIVMLIYTHYNSNSTDSFGWAFAAWIFSYIIMIFYLFFLALCFGNGYMTPKGTDFCTIGTSEALTAALIFSTAVMCYLNIVLNDKIPWIRVFIPIFLMPLFISMLCCCYKKRQFGY